MVKVTTKDDGVTFAVRVQPRAPHSCIVGELDGALKVRLAAPPVDGEANHELIRILAKLFNLSRRQIEIISGETSKNKLVRVNQISSDFCEEILNDALENAKHMR